MILHDFNIIPSQKIIAKELTALINNNINFWKRYFPVTIEKNKTLENSVLFLEDITASEKDKQLYLFGIRTSSNNKLCGLVYLKNIDWDIKEAELAYAIDHQFKGKGWTSKAVKAISNKGFEMGLETLIIIAHKSNTGSVAVAQNCGYIWRETLKNEFTPINEHPLDMELYTLSKQGI